MEGVILYLGQSAMLLVFVAYVLAYIKKIRECGEFLRQRDEAWRELKDAKRGYAMAADMHAKAEAACSELERRLWEREERIRELEVLLYGGVRLDEDGVHIQVGALQWRKVDETVDPSID